MKIPSIETSPLAYECSTCPAIIHIDQLDPNYKGLLATYSEQSYCTLICMKVPQPNQSLNTELD